MQPSPTRGLSSGSASSPPKGKDPLAIMRAKRSKIPWYTRSSSPRRRSAVAWASRLSTATGWPWCTTGTHSSCSRTGMPAGVGSVFSAGPWTMSPVCQHLVAIGRSVSSNT